jgi:transmembrane sensor
MAYNEEHIFQLILEKLSGEISDENRLYLEQAAREDEKIRRCLEEMEDASKVAGPEFMDDVYNEIAWSNVLSLLDNEQAPPPPVPEQPVETPRPEVPAKKSFIKPLTWWLAASVAAAVILLIYFHPADSQKPVNSVLAIRNKITIPLSGDVLLLTDNGDTMKIPETACNISDLKQPGKDVWGTFIVPAGKDYKVTLADGSVVQLNAYSCLDFPFRFENNTREVTLSGEGFFDVAPGEKMPFIVHAGATNIKVLGTSFNINAYSDSLLIASLVKGSIVTDDNHQPDIHLKPGTEVVYRKGSRGLVQTFDENITCSWRNRQYNYANKSLSAIAPVIFHWYGKELLFSDTLLADKKLTGIIERDKPLSEFLDGLDKTSGLTYRISNDKIYLTEK